MTYKTDKAVFEVSISDSRELLRLDINAQGRRELVKVVTIFSNEATPITGLSVFFLEDSDLLCIGIVDREDQINVLPLENLKTLHFQSNQLRLELQYDSLNYSFTASASEHIAEQSLEEMYRAIQKETEGRVISYGPI